MEREPERLAEVSGISPQRARQNREEFRVQVGMRQLMEFFTAHQLPAELALRAYKYLTATALWHRCMMTLIYWWRRAWMPPLGL